MTKPGVASPKRTLRQPMRATHAFPGTLPLSHCHPGFAKKQTRGKRCLASQCVHNTPQDCGCHCGYSIRLPKRSLDLQRRHKSRSPHRQITSTGTSPILMPTNEAIVKVERWHSVKLSPLCRSNRPWRRPQGAPRPNGKNLCEPRLVERATKDRRYVPLHYCGGYHIPLLFLASRLARGLTHGTIFLTRFR